MTKEQLHYILDALFYNFEQNIFVNDGVWPRQANLIFAFADYIDNLQEEDVLAFLPKDVQFDLESIKHAAMEGINLWLNENMKTLMM